VEQRYVLKYTESVDMCQSLKVWLGFLIVSAQSYSECTLLNIRTGLPEPRGASSDRTHSSFIENSVSKPFAYHTVALGPMLLTNVPSRLESASIKLIRLHTAAFVAVSFLCPDCVHTDRKTTSLTFDYTAAMCPLYIIHAISELF
jgi:hypothetical protein